MFIPVIDLIEVWRPIRKKWVSSATAGDEIIAVIAVAPKTIYHAPARR